MLVSTASFAQVADVIKVKYPETAAGDLVISSNTTYNPKLKQDYRKLYSRLQDGIVEIDKFEKGGADAEILQIFELKDLKDLQKNGTLNELTNGLKAEQNKIAQVMREEKYGADSASCIRALSMSGEFFKQKNYKDAYPSWSLLFRDFPCSSQNIYSNGVIIVKEKMKEAKDAKERELWVDTLMMVYDQRIKYFAKSSKKYGEGYLLGRKGVDLLKYRKNPIEAPYEILTKSVEMTGVNCEYAVIQTAFQSVIGMYEQEKIGADEVVDKYLKYTELLSQMLTALGDDAANAEKVNTVNTVIKGVDDLFSASSAAKCDVLIQAFEPRFKANSNDIDLLKKIVGILDKKECTDSQLYEDATAKLIEKEPSELACKSFARLLEKKGKNSDALQNWEKAISYCTIDSVKATYHFAMARLQHKDGNFGAARGNCNQALQLKSNLGQAYILIAMMYAARPVGEDAFEKSKTFWLVIDKLQRAKAVDPSLSNEVNRMIGSYSGQCPKKEEAFMHGVTPGQSISIGGWIGESTTARF